MQVASWIVREIATKRVIFETFNGNLRRTLNAAKYEMVPIGEYLASLNSKGAPGEIQSHHERP